MIASNFTKYNYQGQFTLSKSVYSTTMYQSQSRKGPIDAISDFSPPLAKYEMINTIIG